MNILVNGTPGNNISVLDRGLQYGDGLFETVRVYQGRLRLWPEHMLRLSTGCRRLGIAEPDTELLFREAQSLIGQLANGVLKVIVTRGVGSRGYRTDSGQPASRVLTAQRMPDYPASYWQEGIRARLCHLRLGHNSALAGIKHLNRLEQVMARREWQDDGIMEGILRDQAGYVVEGTMSNIFLVHGAKIVTPALESCGVAGIMRGKILEIATAADFITEVRQVSKDELAQADEVFVTNSLIGLWPVKTIDKLGAYRLYVSKTLQTLLDQYLRRYDENPI